MWQAQCDEMAALAQMEARHWDLLRQTLGEYIAAFEDVEAEEAQRRLHIAKRYDVCTFEAWALERVRVLQQEAEARHAVLTLEGQVSSSVLRCAFPVSAAGLCARVYSGIGPVWHFVWRENWTVKG